MSAPYHSCSEEGTLLPARRRDNRLQPCRPLGTHPGGRKITLSKHPPRPVLRLNNGNKPPLQINSMQHFWQREINRLKFTQDNPFFKQIYV